MNSRLIIRICRLTFSDGRRSLGAAVRGRACCRHHLVACNRLHNIVRARRLACIPRLRVPMTPHDVALNRFEILRVVIAGGVDFATARMMLWGMDLTAAVLPVDRPTRLRRARNSNVSYYVPANPFFSQSCVVNPSQVPENTREEEGGAACTRNRQIPWPRDESSACLATAFFRRSK
jgi:hypothetical protein